MALSCSRSDSREEGEQLRGFLDNPALFLHQVREVDVDELDPLTVIWIPGQALPGEDIASTTKIHNNLLLRGRTLEESTDSHIDDVHPEVIAPIYERSPALKLLHEEAEEMRLIRIVYPFYTPLGDDAAAISLYVER